MVYDIGITEPPTCAEINFGFPCEDKWASIFAESLIRRINTRFTKNSEISFPDGAFMADTILYDNELHLVDFSPRMSSSGTKMMYHACGDLSYAKDVIHALLGHYEQMDGSFPVIPTYYSFIPFPKGRISNVQYPELSEEGNVKLVEKVTPIIDDHVFEMRNDVQVASRGWIVATAQDNTRADAQKMAESFIGHISYDINVDHQRYQGKDRFGSGMYAVKLDTGDRARILEFLPQCNLDEARWGGLADELWGFLTGAGGNLWGAFDGKELVAITGMVLVPNAPHYVINTIITKRQGGKFDTKRNGLYYLFNSILTEMEERQYYRYYGHMTFYIYKMYTKYWAEQIPMTNRYHYVVEEIVPAGEISQYALFSNFVAQQAHTEPCVIRSGTLMQQYRNEDFQLWK